VLEAVFILLEPLSPSRRFFIGSHSLPPLWFAVSVLQNFLQQIEIDALEQLISEDVKV
jgi:hypothetical protein